MRAIGDTVWVPVPERKQIEQQCPDCMGTAQWHVKLPSGEEFDVECPRCYPGGYSPSTGVIREEWENVVKVQQDVITGIETQGGAENGVRYKTGNHFSFEDSDVCDTEDQAKERATQIGEMRVRDEMQRMDAYAKSKGRPKKDKYGNREATEFDGIRSVVYAQGCIRRAFKDAMSWARFAERKGKKIDLVARLAKQIEGDT
jgi:hypothetical protein